MHFENTVPLQVFKGKKTPKPEFASSHEEADILPIAICSFICGRIACVKILADDTDIFALLTFSTRQSHLNAVWSWNPLLKEETVMT